MSKIKTKTKVTKTLTLSDFIKWISRQPNFQAFPSAQINLWTREFVLAIKANLLNGQSMAFTPVGHLVVEERPSRQLKLPNGQLCEVTKGWSVRFRRRPHEGEYVKRAQWVSILAAAMPSAKPSLRLSMYDGWVDFLMHAMDTMARIEFRGLGGFHIHHRDLSPNVDDVHNDEASKKMYIRFVPSQQLLNAINQR